MSHLLNYCPCNMRAAIDNRQRNEHGYVPVRLLLWTLKCEFHITFTCHEMLFFKKIFPQTFNNVKSFLTHWLLQKTGGRLDMACWPEFGDPCTKNKQLVPKSKLCWEKGTFLLYLPYSFPT